MSKLTLPAISAFCLDSMLQHIFNKYSISSCGIIDKHMGHRPHQLIILNNRTPAHALHDSSGYPKQCLIGYPQHNTFIFLDGIIFHFLNLNFIIPQLSGNIASNPCGALLNILTISDFQRFSAQHPFHFFH